MKSTFKLSALSLAALLAFSQGAQASHNKHHTTAAKASEPAPIVETTVHTKAIKMWDPTPDLLPTSYPEFLQWAEDINGGKSREPLMPCWRNMLCVSGLLDLDALYYDHQADVFGPSASTSGPGVRPMFGNTINQINGSINNANVFVDLKFPELVRIHANIAYVNGSVKEDTYGWHTNADWGSVYRPAASLKADELYGVFSSDYMNPIYLKIGRMYLDFGQYIPNGYGLPTITPSLTQLMTQTRTGGAQFGFALQNGLYASATWSMAEMTMLPFTHANRNYSGKVGFMREFTNAVVNVNLSYLWDITDTDYMNEALFILNNYIVPAFADSETGDFHIRRQHAFAGHADAKFGQLGLAIEGAATTGPLNPYQSSSNLWTAGADVSYDFPTAGHDSSIDLGYQIARHTKFIYGNGVLSTYPTTGFPLGPLGNQLPSSRVVATYIFKVVPHVNTALQWVHDKDFGNFAGTDRTSNFGVFRIDLEF